MPPPARHLPGRPGHPYLAITTSTTLLLPAPAPAHPMPDRYGRSNVHTLVEVISRCCNGAVRGFLRPMCSVSGRLAARLSRVAVSWRAGLP